MKKIILIMLTVMLYSCSNNDDNDLSVQEENFYALTVGNSWVYRNYKYNSDTEEYDYAGIIDSISIVNTEEVNGNLYYKFRRLTTGNEIGYPLCYQNGEYFELLRDSIGFLINDIGEIKHANDYYEERVVAEFSWGTIHEKLQESTQMISVESGVFECLDTERYAIFCCGEYDGQQGFGLDHYYYSDGIGLVHSTLSSVNSFFHIFERRLDSYNVQ